MRGNEEGGKIERAGASGEGCGDTETLTVQETAESTDRARVYYDSPYECVQVMGLALFHQLNRIDYFPSNLGQQPGISTDRKGI